MSIGERASSAITPGPGGQASEAHEGEAAAGGGGERSSPRAGVEPLDIPTSDEDDEGEEEKAGVWAAQTSAENSPRVSESTD